MPRATHTQAVRLCSVGLLTLLVRVALAAEPTPVRAAVYFSPHGGATDAVVREIHAATQQILVQAYSFTSAPIAKALLDAHKRGVHILAVLDKSNETDKYSAATFLVNAGMQTLIDDQHAIAHNKVMVIDSATIITGSFNFTKAAEEKNAENLLVITEAPDWSRPTRPMCRPMRRTHTPISGRPHRRLPRHRSSPPAEGQVHGNSRSKVYHLPGCPGYTGMQSTSRVTFGTESDAQQAGYRKAKNCP